MVRIVRMTGLLLITALCIALSSIITTGALAFSSSLTRRKWLSQSAASAAAGLLLPPPARADGADAPYDNPNMPAAPEERSGLIVLRVAEVAQFQEKILRAILNGDLKDVVVTPQQIVFGTQILMRNSNLAGNMKLMIDDEMPKENQKEAAITSANAMNTLQKISSTAAKVEGGLGPADYDEIANLYRLLRVELNALYELLAATERDKYYGYFVAVTEYEKKIAQGVYNPDLDGVLKFDYAK